MSLGYVEKRRLLKLADYLFNNVKREKFNLEVITDFDENDDIESFRKSLIKQDTSCGTAACAVGYCPIVFPRSVGYNVHGEVGIKTKENDGVISTSIVSIYDFCREFFGLDSRQTEYLFMPESYRYGRRGPKSVARRIWQFVRTNGKVPNYLPYYE